MNCLECQDWLQRASTARPRRRALLERHLAACPLLPRAARRWHPVAPNRAPDPADPCTVVNDLRAPFCHRRPARSCGPASEDAAAALRHGWAWRPPSSSCCSSATPACRRVPRPAASPYVDRSKHPANQSPSCRRTSNRPRPSPEPARPALGGADLMPRRSHARPCSAPLGGDQPARRRRRSTSLPCVGQFDSPPPLRAARQEVAQGMQSVTALGP